MQIDDLRVIATLADVGSFTLAAAHLGLSKSGVSQRLQALERELGVQLFQRTTRAVRPTVDGEQLAARARRLVADADEIAALFQGPRNLRGRVRIDLPTGFARTVVMPRLPELLALHPQLELELSTTDRRVDVLREGFDCVVRIGELREPSLVAQRLGLLAMMNCASPGYVQRFGIPTRLEDLERHYIVHYAQTLGTGSPGFEYRLGDEIYEQPMRSLVTVNSSDAYYGACVAGLGIIQAPRYAYAAELERNNLIEILPQHPAAPMPISIVHAHGRQVPKRVRVVMSWLAALSEPLVM